MKSRKLTLHTFILSFLLCSCCASLNSYAQIVVSLPASTDEGATIRQSDFRKANELVTGGRPIEALSIYEELLESPSGILYYNSGIAYQMMGEIGSAKMMMLAAAKYPETREIALQSLEQINALLPFKMAIIPRYPWQKAYDYLVDEMGLKALIWVGAFSLYMTVGGFLWLLFSDSRRKPMMLTAVSTILFLSIVAILSIRHVEGNRFSTGVVTVNSVTLTEDPDLELESTNIAYEGTVFRADLRESRPEEGWYFVTLQNGARGWLMENSFKTVPF